MTGLAALLAALFGFGSCAMTGVREEPKPPAPSACGATPVAVDFEVDVDGDGRGDTVAHGDESADPSGVVVCFATGRVVVANDNHRATEPFFASDVDSDGAYELFLGSVSSFATHYLVLRWDGRVFRDVLQLSDNAPGTQPTETFGCGTPNRVVAVSVWWERRTATLTTHTLVGGHDSKTTLTVNVPRDADRATYAQSLVRPCKKIAAF